MEGALAHWREQVEREAAQLAEKEREIGKGAQSSVLKAVKDEHKTQVPPGAQT